MPIRVLTDVKRLSNGNSEVVKVSMLPEVGYCSNISKAFYCFGQLKNYDIILIDFSPVIFLLGFLKLFSPGCKCKLASLDIFALHPELCTTLLRKIKRWLQILCLKGVDRIFIYSRNNDALCNAYRIDPAKLTYVPFKINSHDFVVNHPISDGGYIFSGGASRRDFTTLIEACRDLPFPVKIVTPAEGHALSQGLVFDRSNLPSNLEIINDDGSIESFVSYIANSRFVVIGTKKQDFASTGTSVYLISMALGKCVMITSGPTTDLILNDNLAVIVPPEDPIALRTAITKLYNDDECLSRIAAAGRNYALSLGGEESFFDTLRAEIAADR